jgi:3-dehydroquinate synthase
MLPKYLITDRPVNQFLEEFFSSHQYSKIGILVDENTLRDCYPIIEPVLPDHTIFQIQSGEQFKTLSTCERIWDRLTEEAFDRHSLFINLGGGVIGDMGGFCASTFKRGMNFVNIPTTLLSQVDASIGGKLGIDYGDFKNHIGLFADPLFVVIDDRFLATLPEPEVLSGYAEILKHGLIADELHWEQLAGSEFPAPDWKSIIIRSLEIKSKIVLEDPFESGLRKVLNFGHTLGHAVESHFLGKEHPLLHGEAIAVGMIMETFLSSELCGLPDKHKEAIINYLIGLYGHHPVGKNSYSDIFSRTLQDKKNRDHQVTAILLEHIGKPAEKILSKGDIIKAIEFYDNLG